MTNIPRINDQLVAQDQDLRQLLQSAAGGEGSSDRILVEGLCAIHERLVNLTTLMLQSAS